jgi:hypothetical protein
MQTRAFSKRTDVGTFWILPNNANGWGLFIHADGNRELLGSYGSPEDAADDVYTQHTGWDDWDTPIRSNAPRDLGEWETQTHR